MRPVARVNEKSIRSLDRRAIATCTYPAHKMEAVARVELRAAGSATVRCATHDLGTGAYTAFTQISFEQLGVLFEKITFELGNCKSPLSLFLSISDWSENVPALLRQNSTKSIILFDGFDLRCVLSAKLT